MTIWFERTYIFMLIVRSLCSWASSRIYIWQVCIFSEAVGPAGVLRACWVIGRFCSCCQWEKRRWPLLCRRHQGPRWRWCQSHYTWVCQRAVVCMCMHSHACWCVLFATVCPCEHSGWCFGLTDSLLANEQLSDITIHEHCHSPVLSKGQHLKPRVSH